MAKPQPAQFRIDDFKIDDRGDYFLIHVSGQRSGRPSQRLTLKTRALKLVEVKISLTQKNKVIDFSVNRINYLPTQGETRIHLSGLLYPGKYNIEFKILKTADTDKLLADFNELLF